MAGAGYKLFNTGDVLTAAQVNTYLMEQTVMVFADAAARTTALSGVVSEGMISYLKDTNAVEVYNGSAWVASDDPNAIQNTIVDAKGDLIAASAADTPARLAVGNNGETLVADSSATTGLRWQGNFAAGKNKIINGAFDIWQRGTTFAQNNYTADRFVCQATGSTATITQQTFTSGTAPVAQYEGQYFLRATVTSSAGAGNFLSIAQLIEDARTFAGQTITFSFWAKADASKNVAVEFDQNFGTGGSTGVNGIGVTTISLTNSWARYSVTTSIPSISGKTVGTNSYLRVRWWLDAGSNFNARTNSLGQQNITFDVWGVQLEAGNTATSFQTATGTLAGELAACQRYYFRYGGNQAYEYFAWGQASSTTNINFALKHPTSMRVPPTSVDFSTVGGWQGGGVSSISTLTLAGSQQGKDFTVVSVTLSGLTTGSMWGLIANNSTSAYIGLNAEL